MDKETKDLIISLLRDDHSPWWISEHYELPLRTVQGYAGMLRSIEHAMLEAGMEYEAGLIALRRTAMRRAQELAAKGMLTSTKDYLRIAENSDYRLRYVREHRS